MNLGKLSNAIHTSRLKSITHFPNTFDIFQDLFSGHYIALTFQNCNDLTNHHIACKTGRMFLKHEEDEGQIFRQTDLILILKGLNQIAGCL